jgi:hypothetical protein
MTEKSRFSYLEIDDGPTRADLEERAEAHRRTAAAAHEAAEAEKTRAHEAEERASRRRQETINLEADAIERRNAAAQTRVSLRKAKAAAARSRKSAKANANNALHKLNYNHYWKNRSEGMEAMKKAATDAGYELTGEIWNEHHDSTDQGRLSYALQSPDSDNTDAIGLHVQWYRMGSGRWELNAYVN